MTTALFNTTPVILAAMTEETQPLLTASATAPRTLATAGGITFHQVHYTFGDIPVAAIIGQTGIGGANAAQATTAAIERYTPGFILYTGTTGGLAPHLAVTDIVCGTTYRYSSADATCFGYEKGQIPQMPAFYSANNTLLNAAKTLADTHPGFTNKIHCTGVLSADSFILEPHTPVMRAAFPDAGGTDMESTFAAQVCHRYNTPLMSIRAVSDLCSPDGADVFHVNTDTAAMAATLATLALLEELAKSHRSGAQK